MTDIRYTTLTIAGDPTPWMIASTNADKKFCVLWLQGWHSTIDKHKPGIIRMVEHSNITFAMLDYAGHGSHPIALEKTTREQQFNEVVAAFDALQVAGYENIIVSGTSFGGYMAALLSAVRDPYALILRAPAIYKDDEFALPYPERQGLRDTSYEAFKYTVDTKSNLDALRAVSEFKGSTYVVEHEIDSVIPRNIPMSYFSVARRGNYLTIPATDHAVAKMSNPEKHYIYIEKTIVEILGLIQAELNLLQAVQAK